MKRLKLAIIWMNAYILIMPVEAKEFIIDENNLSYNFNAKNEGEFYISKDSPPDWVICEKEGSEKTFELCLQENATNAAIKSAKILYWQTWIGLLAFLAAVAAAIFSGFAVRQANKGVKLGYKIATVEIRPYLMLGIGITKKESRSPSPLGWIEYEYSFTIKNIGKSEAFICDMQLGQDYVESLSDFANIDFDIKKTPTGSVLEKAFNYLMGENHYLYPGQDPFSVTIGLSDKEIKTVLDRGEDFIFPLIIEYKDSLGTKYKSACAYRARFSRTSNNTYDLIRHSYVKRQQDVVLEIPKIGL